MSNSGGRGNGQFALGVRNMAQSIIDVDATGINQGGYHRVTIQQSPKNNVTYSNTNSTLYTYNSISYRIQCLAEIGAGCPSNSELRAEWDGV
jgi:hypothetical protein